MMENTIIEVLKVQRNEAMDTIAVLNAHLAAARHEIARLTAQKPSDAVSAGASYDTAEGKA